MNTSFTPDAVLHGSDGPGDSRDTQVRVVNHVRIEGAELVRIERPDGTSGDYPSHYVTALADVQWKHNDRITERDRVEGDDEDHHDRDGETCFGCWCYSCGGRTDLPRIRRSDDRTDLDDPDSHRWCYE